jgi:hypothetical protein
MQFFKNDWFMGPFYSYNHNEKKMAQGNIDWTYIWVIFIKNIITKIILSNFSG